MDFENIEITFALQKLINAGADREKIKQYDIFILPENVNGKSDDLYDAQDAIKLSKLLKSQGIKCANAFDLGLDLPTTERRSNDIWLGEIYILKDVVLPTLISVVSGVLAALIYDWKKRKDLREPAGVVHADITLIKEEGKTQLHYNGDPEGFIKILKTLQREEDVQTD